MVPVPAPAPAPAPVPALARDLVLELVLLQARVPVLLQGPARDLEPVRPQVRVPVLMQVRVGTRGLVEAMAKVMDVGVVVETATKIVKLRTCAVPT